MTQVTTISPAVWAEVETNLGSAAAESWLKEKNLKVAEAKAAEDVKKAITNSTKQDTFTSSGTQTTLSDKTKSFFNRLKKQKKAKEMMKTKDALVTAAKKEVADAAAKATTNATANAVETAGRTTAQGMQEAVETAAETANRNPLFKKIAIGALAAAAVIGTIFAVTNKKDNAEVNEAA